MRENKNEEAKTPKTQNVRDVLRQLSLNCTFFSKTLFHQNNQSVLWEQFTHVYLFHKRRFSVINVSSRWMWEACCEKWTQFREGLTGQGVMGHWGLQHVSQGFTHSTRCYLLGHHVLMWRSVLVLHLFLYRIKHVSDALCPISNSAARSGDSNSDLELRSASLSAYVFILPKSGFLSPGIFLHPCTRLHSYFPFLYSQTCVHLRRHSHKHGNRLGFVCVTWGELVQWRRQLWVSWMSLIVMLTGICPWGN